jgi:hypothetical protein
MFAIDVAWSCEAASCSLRAHVTEPAAVADRFRGQLWPSPGAEQRTAVERRWRAPRSQAESTSRPEARTAMRQLAAR